MHNQLNQTVQPLGKKYSKSLITVPNWSKEILKNAQVVIVQ